MKFIHCLILLVIVTHAKGQTFDWHQTHNWKMYNIGSSKGLKLSIDSLRQVSSLPMNDDSVHLFIKQIDSVPKEKYFTWMGAYYATCVIDTIICKIDISVYGGFLYNEQTKRYYQLPKSVRNEWMNWLSEIKEQLGKPDEIK